MGRPKKAASESSMRGSLMQALLQRAITISSDPDFSLDDMQKIAVIIEKMDKRDAKVMYADMFADFLEWVTKKEKDVTKTQTVAAYIHDFMVARFRI